MNFNFSISDISKNSAKNNTWKIVFTHSDKVTTVCDDTIFELKQDNGFIIPADSIYKVIGDERSYSLFAFSLDTDYPFSICAKSKALDDNDINLLNNLLRYDLNVDLQRIHAQKTLELLLLNIMTSEDFIVPLESNSATLFKKAINILKSNINASISVDELAIKLDISLSNLKRLFAKYSDFGVHDYFNLLKIIKAKALLKEGHSVTETAALTGFANQSYFSAAFKRITGISPKDFLTVKTKATSTKKAASNRDLPSYLL